MDFEDEQKRAPALSSGEPVPPSDWTGFGPSASMEAIYTAHRPALARYLRRRAPIAAAGRHRGKGRIDDQQACHQDVAHAGPFAVLLRNLEGAGDLVGA